MEKYTMKELKMINDIFNGTSKITIKNVEEIRKLNENEYYMIEDNRNEYSFSASSFQALEAILTDYYDSTEHWAILTNQHSNVYVWIYEAKEIKI